MDSKQLVDTGSIVLVCRDPSEESEHWDPAIVERAGNNQQIVCTSFVNGNPIYFEGCRHADDPWWETENAKTIAYQEGIGIWKERPRDKDMRETAEFLMKTAMQKRQTSTPKR